MSYMATQKHLAIPGRENTRAMERIQHYGDRECWCESSRGVVSTSISEKILKDDLINKRLHDSFVDF